MKGVGRGQLKGVRWVLRGQGGREGRVSVEIGALAVEIRKAAFVATGKCCPQPSHFELSSIVCPPYTQAPFPN